MLKNNRKQKKFEHKMASPAKMTKMQIRLCCIHMTSWAQTKWVLDKMGLDHVPNGNLPDGSLHAFILKL